MATGWHISPDQVRDRRPASARNGLALFAAVVASQHRTWVLQLTAHQWIVRLAWPRLLRWRRRYHESIGSGINPGLEPPPALEVVSVAAMEGVEVVRSGPRTPWLVSAHTTTSDAGLITCERRCPMPKLRLIVLLVDLFGAVPITLRLPENGTLRLPLEAGSC